MPLTIKAISNAKAKTKPYKLSDGDGLYLLVQPGGSKLWRLKYHYLGRENTLSIGKYPEVSLIEARDARYAARKQLRDNINPNRQKKEAQRLALFDADNTFRAVAEDWHRTNKKKWVPEHAERMWRRLELYAFPDIGNVPIAQVRTPELVRLLRKLEKQRKAETARRLTQLIYAVFRYGIHCGVLNSNPATDLRGIITPPKATHFAAIHPSGIPELLEKLETTQASTQNKIAIKLLLHVFVRPGELRYGRWEEIDIANKIWTIPAERMKMRRPHVVPLSEPALALLRELGTITGYSKYLFPSQQRRRHPVMSENTINKVLRNMGYEGKQVGHGFRAIASTVLNESGLFRPDVIEAQLAHIEKNNSRKPYNRAEYLQERTSMMQWWSNYLETATRITITDAKERAA